MASILNAQTTNCLQNNFCSYDLLDSVQTPFSNVGTDFNLNYGKYNAPPYPGDVQYAKEDDGDCVPGSSGCVKTDNGILHYDVYYPSDYTKTQMVSCPLPAVIFVHGGGCQLIYHQPCLHLFPEYYQWQRTGKAKLIKYS